MNPNESKRPRRRYDAGYKRHAVELTLKGDRGITEVARELGISPGMLARWRKEQGHKFEVVTMEPMPETMQDKQREIEWLRAELTRMQEREIVLKKSLGILAAPERGMPRSRS